MMSSHTPLLGALLSLLVSALPAATLAAPSAGPSSANPTSTYERRDKDWRNGAIVYQVLVDRFVPPANLPAKRHLYPAPKVLRDGSAPALPGVYLPEAKLNSQELDFRGGDLQSLATRLDHIQKLGAGVLYLNPIRPCGCWRRKSAR